jgi:putative transposase
VVGVEPICQVLTEHELGRPRDLLRGKDPGASARALRDAELKPLISALHEANYDVYGVRKTHAALRRNGIEIGRDQTSRLMRELGLRGVRRGKPKRTTSVTPLRFERPTW